MLIIGFTIYRYSWQRQHCQLDLQCVALNVHEKMVQNAATTEAHLCQRPNNDQNDPDSDGNATADDAGLCLAESLEFLGPAFDLVVGHETQNDRDRTKDDPKEEQTDNTAHHGSDGQAAGLLDGVGCDDLMAKGDGGGGWGRLGHVAESDAVSGSDIWIMILVMPMDCGLYEVSTRWQRLLKLPMVSSKLAWAQWFQTCVGLNGSTYAYSVPQ